jgi:hypothetical protein
VAKGKVHTMELVTGLFESYFIDASFFKIELAKLSKRISRIIQFGLNLLDNSLILVTVVW